jgi:hypothetical protein
MNNVTNESGVFRQRQTRSSPTRPTILVKEGPRSCPQRSAIRMSVARMCEPGKYQIVRSPFGTGSETAAAT